MTAPVGEMLHFTDDPTFAEWLASVLEPNGIIVHAKSFDEVPENRKLSRANIIGVCLNDRSDGIAYLRRLRQTIMNAKLLAFIPKGRSDWAELAVESGAIDFVELPCDDESLRVRIRAAVRRDAKLCPYDIRSCPYDGDNAAPLYRLTPRELEVAEFMVAGHPSKRIGLILGISIKTVEVHRARVFEKTGTKNLPELTRLFVSARSRPVVSSTPAPVAVSSG
ncbi:MAG: LuxR C-terminal-related transcriptional regulator [Pseudomonadota bacterium]